MSLLIAFSGQGSQHTKMFELLAADEYGRAWLKEASDIMSIDLLDESAVEKACSDVILVQCLIVILSAGVFYVLKRQLNLDRALLCGYSLGEVSAFTVSAHLDLNDICDLVKHRAFYMQEAASKYTGNKPSGMAALKGKINIILVQQLIDAHHCFLAIINADDHFIIGGLISDIDALLIDAKEQGVVKAERLAVRLPSHTAMLNKASQDFSLYLRGFSSKIMEYPILNALSQEKIYRTEDMLPILVKELSEILYWDKVMRVAGEYGASLFLEIGPGSALKNMAVSSLPQIRSYNLEGFSSLNGLINFISLRSETRLC